MKTSDKVSTLVVLTANPDKQLALWILGRNLFVNLNFALSLRFIDCEKYSPAEAEEILDALISLQKGLKQMRKEQFTDLVMVNMLFTAAGIAEERLLQYEMMKHANCC